MIIDASVVLTAFFPDEIDHPQAQALIRAYALDDVELHGPELLSYEVTNAILQAVRRRRITLEIAQEILTAFEDLSLPLEPVIPNQIFAMAYRFDRSAYDAAYLSLAERLNTQLITGDQRLYNTVSQYLPWVVWVGDYR
jgi:predicted nucleic acid-binding protein